jgi:hypothetical protein
MSFKLVSTMPVMAACAAAAAIALAGPASAAQDECTNSGSSTVCEQPGNSTIFAAPGDAAGGGQSGQGAAGAGNANVQNGTYGPAGGITRGGEDGRIAGLLAHGRGS